MSETPILRELKPSPLAGVSLYSSNVTGATGTVFCMNQGAVADQVSVALVPQGNVLASNNWLCNDSFLFPGHSLYLQQLCVDIGDSIYVRSKLGSTSFIFTGHEI